MYTQNRCAVVQRGKICSLAFIKLWCGDDGKVFDHVTQVCYAVLDASDSKHRVQVAEHLEHRLAVVSLSLIHIYVGRYRRSACICFRRSTCV